MDIITYALSKKIAAHALSGVQSMSVSGQTLTINTKDSGVLTMTFPTPKDGVSVTDIDVNANNQIVFTMSDGSEIISGKIPTVKGDKGDPGVSPIITENADNTDKIYKLDITTADSTFTTPNLKGTDSGGSGEENMIESISVNGTPISIDENKNVDITVPTVTNDLTDELKSSYDEAVAAKHTHDNKTVLDGITAEKVESWDKAEENVQSDWNETDDTADGFIKNKPTIPDITGLATETYVDNKVADYTKTVDLADVATSGSYNDLADKPTIPSLDGYAKTSEIPTKVSELENDSSYLSSIPEEYVTDTELEAKGYLTEHQDISGKVDKVEGKSLISDAEIARLATVNNYDDTDIKAEIAKKADTTAIPNKVSELTNDSNYQTAEQVNSTVTTEIAKVVADAPEDFDTLKEMSDWIAGHKDDASAMNSAISDNKTAITALQTGKADKSEIPTTVAELTDSADYAKTADVNDSISALQTNKADASDLTAHTDDTNIHVTADNKATWNTVSNKVDKEDGKGLSANDYTNEEKALVGTIEDKINKTSIATALDDTVTDEQVASALLAKTELDKKIDKTSIASELSDASTDDEVVGALTAYNELQKLESANKEQFATASGDYITVNDSVDGNIVELGVKGNSFQQSYSGKNLLNPTLETTTQNGVTCTNNGDGTYTLNGNATTNTWITLGKAKLYSGKTYRLCGLNKVDNSTLYIQLRNDNIITQTTNNGINVNITETSKDYIVVAFIPGNATYNNVIYKPMLTTNLSATYDDFEPYVGGIPAPNPLYPQAINSVGDDRSIVVKSRGKNMIPFPYYDGMSSVINGITFTANEDGSVTANGTAIGNAYFRFANKNMYSLENGKTYAISRGKTKDIYMYAQNSSGDFVVLKVDESAKFTCNDTWRYIGCYVPKDTTVTNETIYPMLVEVNEDGTYSTEYEPYKSSTSIIPLSEPLRAIGDIKDEITYQDGKWGVLRRIKEFGISDMSIQTPGNFGDVNYTYTAMTTIGVAKPDSPLLSNLFTDQGYLTVRNNNVIGCGCQNNGNVIFGVGKESSITTIELFTQWASDNDLKLQFILATPVFEPFADQTLPYLSTYDGVTNISNDDELSAEMTVKYPTTDASGIGSRNESRIAELAKDTDDKFDDVKESLGTLEFGEVAGGKNLTKNIKYTTQSGIYKHLAVGNVYLEKGKTYTMSFTATSDGIGRIYIPNGVGLTNNSPVFVIDSTTIRCKKTAIAVNGNDGKNKVDLLITASDNEGTVTITDIQIEEGTQATEYEPYIPSVKILADENEQQNIEAMDLKMLGWSVPKECPIQNYVDSDGVFHQRVGRVDLGGLTWSYATNPNRFNANFNSVKFVGNDTPIVAYSKKYDIYSFNTAVNTSISKDKAISVYGSNGIASILVVIDSSYTDADTFKNAMQGQYLYYELATPITMTIDGNEATERLNDSLSVIGKCKNLLNSTLQTTTQNGVTCTNNGDGTYTLNGTANDRAIFYIFINGAVNFEAGTYNFILCKNISEIEDICGIGIYFDKKGWISNLLNSTVSLSDNDTLTQIWIDIKSGKSVNNLVIKPMLTTDLNATYDDFVPYTGDGETLTHDVAEIKNTLVASNAGAHNCVYRGKYLGNALTTEQKAQISAGTFNDLYIGDYWTIGGVNYRIAAFDYWLNSGDTQCTKHHVVIVPDTGLYTAKMNTTNVTTGAYIGSEMYTTNLEQAKTIINDAFGSENILSHREYLAHATNATSDLTYENAGSWHDSTVELMNERMVYGADIFHNIEVNGAIPINYTISKSQLPLFALEPSRICNRTSWWLRDVVSAAAFAGVGDNGIAYYNNASVSLGVRPAFGITG